MLVTLPMLTLSTGTLQSRTRRPHGKIPDPNKVLLPPPPYGLFENPGQNGKKDYTEQLFYKPLLERPPHVLRSKGLWGRHLGHKATPLWNLAQAGCKIFFVQWR